MGERKVQFDMSADTVTLDLLQLKLVLGSAMCNARNKLNRTEAEILCSIEQAIGAERKGDTYEHYRQLCHANTSREYLERYAQQYAEAIQAYFHVCEAIKRDETIIVKP